MLSVRRSVSRDLRTSRAAPLRHPHKRKSEIFGLIDEQRAEREASERERESFKAANEAESKWSGRTGLRARNVGGDAGLAPARRTGGGAVFAVFFGRGCSSSSSSSLVGVRDRSGRGEGGGCLGG